MYNGALVRYEVGTQFGAGGTGAAEELAAGAYMIMVESEGITESVWVWRTDVPNPVEEAAGSVQDKLGKE